MKKGTYIDYAVLMAVRSGSKKKSIRMGLMLIAKAFDERQLKDNSNQKKTLSLQYEQYVSEGITM